MSRKLLIRIIGMLAFALAGVVGYRLSPLLRPAASVTLPPAPCDVGLTGTCTVFLPDGRRLAFSIAPHPVRALHPLQLHASLSGNEAQKIEVDFDGTEMRMGYNRVLLKENAGRFSGHAMLPVCITGTMTWAATVLITTESGTVAAPFHFVVEGR